MKDRFTWIVNTVLMIATSIVLVGSSVACTNAEMNIITMVAESFPTKQSVNVIVDAVDQLGRKPDLGQKYPFDAVRTTPYTHSIVYEKRFLVTMTLTVIATEPGQTVLCSVYYNGKLIPTAAGQGKYGQGHAALCVYPPRKVK